MNDESYLILVAFYISNFWYHFRELDHAMLRRLEKRILVDLPTTEARQKMIEYYLPETITSQQNGLQISAKLDYKFLAEVSSTLASTFIFFSTMAVDW